MTFDLKPLLFVIKKNGPSKLLMALYEKQKLQWPQQENLDWLLQPAASNQGLKLLHKNQVYIR